MPQDLYTFASAREELRLRLGGRSSVTDQDFDKRLDRWLDSAQLMLAKSDLDMPRLEQVNTNILLVANEPEYALAQVAAFGDDIADTQTLADSVGFRMVRNETDDHRLSRMAWPDYRRLASASSTGAPACWARHGHLFAVHPTPDDTYTLKVDYRRRPRLGEAELESEWHEPWINIALWIGWRALQMPKEAEAAFSGLPAELQIVLQRPLSQEDWEKGWNLSHIHPSISPGDN